MDKNEEEKSVYAVYELTKNDCLIKSERPDFIIRNQVTGENRGIEVTDFHYSESMFAVQNSNNLFNCIISEKNVRSKKYRKHIRYEEFVKLNQNGEECDRFSAIMTVQGENDIKKINTAIEEKNMKHSEYDQTLDFIDLIIHDCENVFDDNTAISFSNVMLTTMLFSIFDSPFREIFFLTKNNGKDVFIPMRCQLLIYLVKILADFLKDNNQINDDNVYENMSWVLAKMGISKISFDSTGLFTTGYRLAIENKRTIMYSTFEMFLPTPIYNNIVVEESLIITILNKLSDLGFDNILFLYCKNIRG